MRRRRLQPPATLTVLAFDLASKSGWAFGRAGEVPSCGSRDFAVGPRASHSSIFGTAYHFAIELITIARPDVLVLEAPLSLHAVSNRTTILLLAGLQGCARAAAFNSGVYDVRLAHVPEVRRWFIGKNYRTAQAKAYTLEKCRDLGWPVARDYDAADACAVWSYQCAQLVPESGLRVSPLFTRLTAAK